MSDQSARTGDPENKPVPCAGTQWIASGTFRMGDENGYPEEAPSHEVMVSPFWMDAHTVSNARRASFVEATGYLTIAESSPDPSAYPAGDPALLAPGSAVFFMPSARVDMNDIRSRLAYVPGANCCDPEGLDSTIEGRERELVVHGAFEDAAAHAAWGGKALPTEAEWEFAARGGLHGAPFCRGQEFMPGDRYMANAWQGPSPFRNQGLDGFAFRAPVGSLPPHSYSLYDMAGNFRERTTDWFPSDIRHAAPRGSSPQRRERGNYGLHNGRTVECPECLSRRWLFLPGWELPAWRGLTRRFMPQAHQSPQSATKRVPLLLRWANHCRRTSSRFGRALCGHTWTRTDNLCISVTR
jgi:formylglycine-generating enzyme